MSAGKIETEGVCGALAGKQGRQRQVGSLQAVLIALTRRNGGCVTVTRDELERAFEYGGGIEFDARDLSNLKIALHEQVGDA